MMDQYQIRVALQDAVNAKRAGDFETARQIYRRITAIEPREGDAWKGWAKVEIAAGNYEAAIRALLMKVYLGIYYSKRIAPDEFRLLQQTAFNNLRVSTFRAAVQFDGRTIAADRIGTLLGKDAVARDVALLAWAETDLYFYLGHCLMRLYPGKFAVSVPEIYLKNLENALAGTRTGTDARHLADYAPLFYITGFLLAVVNVRASMSRFCDESQFSGRFDGPVVYTLESKPWWARLF